MIRITKGQEVQGEQSLSVVTETGDYEDTALIECVGTGSVVVYQAQYVKYGQLVYQHSDPIELGRALLLIDPESTHSAASYVRMSTELLAKMNAGSLEPDSLDEVIATEQSVTEAQRENRTENLEESPDNESIRSESLVPVEGEMSTTTPEVLGDATDSAASSTTPDILGAPASTTIESFIPLEDSATSSPTGLDGVVPEASSTQKVLYKGGKKIAKLVRQKRS